MVSQNEALAAFGVGIFSLTGDTIALMLGRRLVEDSETHVVILEKLEERQASRSGAIGVELKRRWRPTPSATRMHGRRDLLLSPSRNM